MLEKNKRLVRDFYDLAFNQHHPVEAAERFLAVDYIQHNPGVADGRQNAQDRGVAVVDIFRVQGELITEHWDVGQRVPESSKNKNTMF